jgi:ribosomal-protein-alanine N-acetyltransferase
MNYRIVDVTEEYLDAIAELERMCFSCPWTAEQLKTQLKDDRHEFIMAIDDSGEVLAYVGMMYILDEGYISNVAVSPKYRRQGIADSVIESLLAKGEELKLSFITLEVRAGNEAAKSLYQKHGFLPVGQRKNYYDLPKEDAILMTKFWNRGN